MTLALYGKSRRRQGVLVLLAVFAVMAALIGGAAVRQAERVDAAATTSVQLNPTADGGDSAWADSPDAAGANDFQSVNDATCAAGDTDYIFETGTGTDSSSFDVTETTIPNGALITSVNVTFCYSDHDTTDADEQIRPYARLVGNKSLGTTVSFAGGSQTPTLAATQQIAVSLFKESDAALDLEIGVDSLNGDDVRVYAIWATVTYKTAREIKVQKVASTASHAGGSFSAAVTDTTPNPDVVTNVPLTLAAGVQTSAMSGPISAPFGDVVTAAETPPPGWMLFGFRWIQNNAGDQTCPTAATGYATGNNQIPADNNDYLLCVRNAPSAPDLLVEKTSSVPSITLPTTNYDWNLNLKNVGTVAAVFGNNALVFTDQLPNVAGVSYSVIDDANDLGCSINGTSKLLTCSAGASGFTMAGPSTIAVTVSVTATNTGTLTNGATACSIDPSSLAPEANEDNNACPTSAVTVNPAAACTTTNVAACIALLSPIPATQTPPANTCQGVNANFVVDVSDSVDDTELAAMKSGIQSFTAVLGASSKFAGSRYAATAANFTTGYVTHTAFSTAVGNLDDDQGLYTWTEGGIAAARTNTANPLASAPPVMFVVTDGSPNATASGQTPTLTTAMTWVNAANEAIAEANAARGNFWVRVVRAGPADSNLPFTTSADDQLFADAVMTRLAAGAFVPTSFDGLADALLSSAGCNPEVVKSAGIPVQTDADAQFDAVDWVITITNSSGVAKTGVVVNDANANSLQQTVFNNAGGSCSPATGTGPWTCSIPAKAGTVNGLGQLTVRTILPTYNVCVGTSGTNTAVLTGGIVGSSNPADYTILPLSASDPSCLSDITVHKIEEGSFATASNTWNMRLNNGTTNTDQNITDGGTTVFTPLSNGTYSVTELNAGAVATCSPTVAAGSYTVAWSDTQNGTYTQGAVRSGIVINGTGQHHHVWFKNTPCPPVVSIAKTNSDADGQIPAGSSFTWTIAVNVAVNPTTAAITVADSVPAGFTINTVTETAFGSCSFAGLALTNCILPAGTAPGTYTIAIAATAPADFPRTNCAAYTNTATLSGTSGMTVIVAPGETAAAGTATDPVTVTNCRDPRLTLTKTNSGLPPALGPEGTFNWVVTALVEDGPTVSDATISDTLPAGFTVNNPITDAASGTGDATKMSCTPNAAVPGATGFTCTLLTAAPNGTYTITVPVKAPTVTAQSQCGPRTNTVTASFAAGGTVVQTNNTNTVTITCPALTIAKSAVAGSVNLGSNVQYDLTVTNTSAVTATGVTVNDTLPNPAGLVWQTPPQLTWSAGSSVGSCSIAGNALSCSGITINAGANLQIRMTATTNTATTRAVCGDHVNNAATATVIGNTVTSGSATVTVNCPAVTISKVANPIGPVTAGSNIGWTFTIQNSTAIAANGNVSVSDTLPTFTGVNWTQGTAAETSTTGSCSVSGSILACTGLTVPASSSITVTVTGTTTGTGANRTCGTITNTGAIVTLLSTDVVQGSPASVLVECPDPSVVKTVSSPAGPTPSVDSGDTITYSVTVSAGGTGPSSGVILNDTLQAGMSWTVTIPAGVTCNGQSTTLVLANGGTVSCTIGTMAQGTSKVFSFTATTTANQCANDVDNTAIVSATADVDDSNNSSSPAPVDVKCPNVVLSKVQVPNNTDVTAGGPVTFQVTASNTGTGAAKDFFLSDTLPTSVTGWTIVPASNVPADSCAITAGVLRCPGVSGTTTLAAGASITVQVTGTTQALPGCPDVSNTASASASNDLNPITDSTDDANILCPDMKVQKDGNGPVNAGDKVVFTITVDNLGLGTASNVVLSDTLTPGTQWTSQTALPTECTLDPVGTNPQKLSCTWAQFDAAKFVTIILEHPTTLGSGLGCSPVSNTASLTLDNEASDLGANNSDDATVDIQCGSLRISKTPVKTPVSAGDNISFVINVWNEGPGIVNAVLVKDLLPTGLTWTQDNDDCDIVDDELTCNFGNLSPSIEDDGVKVTLTSPTTAATCPNVTNALATASSSNTAPATVTNSVIVVNCPDISVEKVLVGDGPVSAGDDITFKITVTVSGPDGTVARSVTLNEELPPTTSGWEVQLPSECATLIDELFCAFGDVPIEDGPVTFEVIITGKAIGTNGEVTCSAEIINAVSVSAGNEDPTKLGNNSDTAAVGVNCPKIELTKSASSGSVTAGDPITFTITVKNTGGGAAHSVMVTDDLPEGLAWNTADSGCTILGDKLTCNFAELASAAEKSVQVTATTDPAVCTSLSNQAFASAGNDGVDGSVASNTETVSLLCSDVSITKAPETGGEVLDLGESIKFNIIVTAAAGGDAHNVVVTDTLPDGPGLIWTTITTGCTVTAAADPGPAQVLSCTFAEIEEDTSKTIVVTSNALSGAAGTCGEIPNIASVVAGNEDPTKLTNNTSNRATVFVNCPDLEVLKTGVDVNYGATPVFTITVENKGVGVAKDVVITDVFPSFGTWTITTSDDCDVDGDEVTCETLGEDGKVTLTVTGSAANTCEPLVNSVSAVASNEVDPDEFENSDEATINVACGTIQIVKIDNVLEDNPNLGAAWDFTVDNGGQVPFANQSIALGGGSVTVQKVPFGTYTVTEVQDTGFDVCPVPNPARTFRTLVDDETQEVNAQNLNVTFTFTNEECGVVGATGFLEIHKVSDINGNHVMDAGDTKLGGWPMTITGPEFPSGVVIETDSQGRVLLPGIEIGNYTVTEGARAGYTNVGVVVDDNGPVFSAANTATVDLEFNDTDVITFYNQPRGSIVVRKNAVIRHNGIESDSPADRDGWVMTVSSAACGVNQQLPTNASGTATFSNLPMCSDYLVSENPVNAGSPNFNVVGSPSRSPFTPGLTVATEVTFTNERVTTDPPCPNCSQQPTPTPTQAPPTPSATPSNTAVPTNTVGPSTPTTTPSPVSTTAGERTPGPAQPTPIAPSTGEGIFGGAVGGTNLLLVLAGLAALAGGLAVVALGRRGGGR